MFALLGLRSLYFAFAGMLGIFRYVQASFLVILVFIAVKMLLVDTYPVPLPLSVGFVAIAIAGGVGMSVARAARHGGWDFALLELEPGSLAPINQRQAKRIIALVVGTTLLLFGTAMLVLPGPGILTIGGGLAVLSSEVVWARRLLNRVRRMFGMDALPDPPEERRRRKGEGRLMVARRGLNGCSGRVVVGECWVSQGWLTSWMARGWEGVWWRANVGSARMANSGWGGCLEACGGVCAAVRPWFRRDCVCF